MKDEWSLPTGQAGVARDDDSIGVVRTKKAAKNFAAGTNKIYVYEDGSASFKQ